LIFSLNAGDSDLRAAMRRIAADQKDTSGKKMNGNQIGTDKLEPKA
jgi:hypothetical protein